MASQNVSDILKVIDTNLNSGIQANKRCNFYLKEARNDLNRLKKMYHESRKINTQINCSDPHPLHDLGCADFKTFLLSIKKRVALRFEMFNGLKTILKRIVSSKEIPVISSHVCQQEGVPLDAASPDFVFKRLLLLENYDFSEYIPVCVSAVAHPGFLYIQLQNDKATKIFKKLVDVEPFYHGSQSELYAMKDIHIKAGAACMALWPVDQRWYRSLILSIPSTETVTVYHIDYGTWCTIHKSFLKYIKKDHAVLPALAMRCNLYFIHPANHADHWDPLCQERLIDMCNFIPLLAKIDDIQPNGVYSIVLCNTDGRNINDALINEGFAEYCDNVSCRCTFTPTKAPEKNVIPQPGPSEENQSLSLIQGLQTHHLNAFTASFTQNETYLKLPQQQTSKHCQNSDLLQQNLSFNPAFGTPNSHSRAHSNVMNNAFAQGANGRDKNPSQVDNAIPLPPTSAESPLSSVKSPNDMHFTPVSPEINSQENKNEKISVTVEEDDAFQEIFQKLSAKTRRFVKRILLDGGYKIHIIVVQSKPFASSGDISQLIWNDKEADYLSHKFQLKNVDIPSFNLSEDGNEELFYQLRKLNVQGIHTTTGSKTSILVYPLKMVIKILNTFGHPSMSIRAKITEEITNFNPDDQEWKEFYASESLIDIIDSDKIERLCLYDLLAVKEEIVCRRFEIMYNLKNEYSSLFVDELSKLELMRHKVLQRIEEIKEICDLFD